MIGIAWDKKYHSVGHKELDEQHKTIVDLINKLSAQQSYFYGVGVGTGIGLNVDNKAANEFDLSLAELKKHILDHLAYEEALLKQINYQDLSAQTESHLHFIDKMNCISTDNNDSKYEMAKFLVMWWDNHILKEDMKYKPYLQNL